uniref:G_PROTEIN_RECEP_F1_2 domain-containing protein n=1 Tax=Parastrongyloides trichosuri TaxID=131310 RepID=A0A0N4Z4P4_PARTI
MPLLTKELSEESIAAVSSIGSIGIAGLIINITCLIRLLRTSDFKNCFGYIVRSQIFANIGTLFCFVFWSCLSIIFCIRKDIYNILDKCFGTFIIFCWNLGMYCHVFISLNRFIALFFPLRYDLLFEGKGCKIYVSLLWIVSLTHIIPFFSRSCYFIFDSNIFVWSFGSTPCSYLLSEINFDLSIAYTIFCLAIDFIIFIKLGIKSKNFKRCSKRMRQVSVAKNSYKKTAFESTTINDKKSKKNSSSKFPIKFFMQSFCQNVLVILQMISFHFFSPYSEDTLQIMAYTTIAWNLHSSIDGLIVFFFHKEIRRNIFKCC